MSTAESNARDIARKAGLSGDPAMLKMTADLTGSTPDQVKAAARIGALPAESPVIDPTDPYGVAMHFIESCWSVNGIRELNHHAGQFYEYRRGCHTPGDRESLRAGIASWLLSARKEDGKHSNGETKYIEVKPNTRLVNEVLDAVKALCNLHSRYVAPCWLEREPGQPPADEIISVSNGLLHVPLRTLDDPTPLFWTHSALPFAYRADTNPPAQWEQFLCEVFQDDPEAISTLQEWFGLMLLPDTKHQKILLIVGPKRSGKGTIARILTAMLGADNVCAPTLAGLSNPFGLSPLIGKLAAIISDARLSGRADQATIAERLLSISGEDTVTVERKYLPAWTGRLSTRFVILTNELPRLADASGALASRFIVLTMNQSFYGREDHGLYDRLLTEMPGIFGWALTGYDRLRRRGHLVQPESSDEAIQELEDLGSPVGAFIRDRCGVGPGKSVLCSDLYEAWKAWCESEGRNHPGTAQSFGRDLRAAVPGLRVTQPRQDFERVRQYEGIALK